MGQARSCSNLWTLLAPMILDSAPIVRNIQGLPLKKRRSTFRKRLSSPALLILDEWLSRPISEELKRLIFDVVEDRLGKSSTIFCSQHSFSNWMDQLGSGCATESLIDRVIHNATTIVLDGKCNMREISQKYNLNHNS